MTDLAREYHDALTRSATWDEAYDALKRRDLEAFDEAMNRFNGGTNEQ